MNAYDLEKNREKPLGGPAFKLWHARVDKARRWRYQHWNGDKVWERAWRLVIGDHWRDRGPFTEADAEEPNARIMVNLAGSIAHDFEAYLMRAEPRFLGEARFDAADQTAAELQGELLTYQWQELRFQKQAQRAVRDMIMIGHGVVRTGFTIDIDTAVRPNKQGEVEYNDYVRAENPSLRWVDPRRFVFDPDAPEYDLDSGRWAAEFILRPLLDVLDSKRYNEDENGRALIGKIKKGILTPTTYKDWAQMEPRADGILEEGGEDDPGRQLVVVIDLWDKKFRQHFHLLAGCEEEALLVEDWPYDHLDGFPFIMGTMIEVNRSHYPKGIVMEMADQQWELDRIRTAQFTHRRRLGRRLYKALQSVEPSELQKLRTGKDGDTIIVSNMGALAVIEDAPIPADTFRVEEIIKEDMRELTGQSAMMAGHSLPSRTSASEIRERQTYAGMKLEARVNAVDDFILQIGRQILQHDKRYMRKSTVIRITGPFGMEWKELSEAEIRAEADIRLISTTTPKGQPDMERQQAANLVQMILGQLPVLQQSGLNLNLVELFKWLFAKFGISKEVGRFFGGVGEPPGPQLPAVPPGQEMSQQMPPEMPFEQLAIQQGMVTPESPALGEALGNLSGGRR